MTDTLIAANRQTGVITVMRGKARGQTHWHGIVKVQRSINPGGIALIYNEARTIMHQQPMPRALERMFLPDEWKFYAQATYESGLLKVNNRVTEREW